MRTKMANDRIILLTAQAQYILFSLVLRHPISDSDPFPVLTSLQDTSEWGSDLFNVVELSEWPRPDRFLRRSQSRRNLWIG